MTRDIFVYITGLTINDNERKADFLSKFEVSTKKCTYRMIPYIPTGHQFDMQWLKRCDVLFRINGGNQEIILAKKHGLMLVYNVEELARWIKECLIEK